jgi:hypothetical protein
LLVLTACGGGSGAASTRKAQTATAGAVSDAATVTAFAKGQAATTPGAQGGTNTTGVAGTTGTTGTTGTPAASAGKSPFFTFATVGAGGAGGAGGGTTGRGATAGTGPATGTGANASPASRATAAGVRGSTYTDPQGRFSFTIPSGWTVQQSTNSNVDVEVAPPNLRGAFRLASDAMPADASLSDYASAVLDNIQTSFTNFQLIGNVGGQTAMIGGQVAVRYEFTGSQSGTDLHGVVYIVNKGDTVYGIFIAAATSDFDALNNQVKPLLDSFTFT